MKGSITVEAAFVMGIILLILMFLMKETIALYQQAAEEAAEYSLSSLQAVSDFRRTFFLKDIFDIGGN